MPHSVSFLISSTSFLTLLSEIRVPGIQINIRSSSWKWKVCQLTIIDRLRPSQNSGLASTLHYAIPDLTSRNLHLLSSFYSNIKQLSNLCFPSNARHNPRRQFLAQHRRNILNNTINNASVDDADAGLCRHLQYGGFHPCIESDDVPFRSRGVLNIKF